jgi:Uma2 family endonuclease
MTMLAVDVRRWTRQEYERMAAAGLFQPEERLELIEGTIYRMTPQSSRHAVAIQLIEEALRRAFPPGCSFRVQMPLALGDFSQPEPDLAVVSGAPRDHLAAHPGTALLVVEVADRSLPYDRTEKLSLYARAGIPEYWLVDIQERTLAVHRDPAGGAYRSRALLRAGDAVAPLACPEGTLPVADLLA